MVNEFVKYEQALALKELCFDDMCFCYFDNEKELRTCIGLKNWNSHYGFPLFVSAPLKQQVFRWFREKYNIIGIIEGGYTEGKNVFSYVIWQGHLDDWTDDIFNTYEEAQNVCIDKLIEIAKQKDNGHN
jgi:hypothetical protein